MTSLVSFYAILTNTEFWQQSSDSSLGKKKRMENNKVANNPCVQWQTRAPNKVTSSCFHSLQGIPWSISSSRYSNAAKKRHSPLAPMSIYYHQLDLLIISGPTSGPTVAHSFISIWLTTRHRRPRYSGFHSHSKQMSIILSLIFKRTMCWPCWYPPS